MRFTFFTFQTDLGFLDLGFTLGGKTLHILGDGENKSCKKSRVLSLFKCIGILVGQQASSTAAVGSLDFADNGLSGEKKKQVSLDFFLELTITRQLELKFCQLSTELIVNQSHSLWRWANARNVSFKTLYGCLFTLSTQLITPLYSPTDAEQQFFQKLILFIILLTMMSKANILGISTV